MIILGNIHLLSIHHSHHLYLEHVSIGSHYHSFTHLGYWTHYTAHCGRAGCDWLARMRNYWSSCAFGAGACWLILAWLMVEVRLTEFIRHHQLGPSLFVDLHFYQLKILASPQHPLGSLQNQATSEGARGAFHALWPLDPFVIEAPLAQFHNIVVAECQSHYYLLSAHGCSASLWICLAVTACNHQ